MKTFLKIDLGIQAGFYLISAIGLPLIFIKNNYEIFFFGFMGLGAWQLFSASLIMLSSFGGAGRAGYFFTAVLYVLASVFLFWIMPVYLFGAFLISVWYFKKTYLHLNKLENEPRSFWDLA